MVIVVPSIPEHLRWTFCSRQAAGNLCPYLATARFRPIQAAEPFSIADLHTFSKWHTFSCKSTIAQVIMQLQLSKFRIPELALPCA